MVKNKGNLNNHIGLPLSLMQLRSGPDMAVLELGMNHAGEIRTLVGIAEPDVRVWTNVGDAHLGFFASSDAIADAKAEILEGARRVDAARVLGRRRAHHGPPRRVSRADGDVRRVARRRRPGADIQDRGLDGMRATRRDAARHGAASTTPLLGRANLANVLAATAVATECGVPLEVVRDRVARLSDRPTGAGPCAACGTASPSSTTPTTPARPR